MAQVYWMNVQEIKMLPESFFEQHFPRRYHAAQRYRFEADRLRAYAAGALLWERFGDVEEQILFGDYGKPYFAHESTQFNLSHSGDIALLATSACMVGADVEKCTRENLPLAKKVFTTREREWMEQDPVVRFTRLWTLKESVMKALGKGLQLAPESFEVLPLTQGGSIEIDSVKLFAFTDVLQGYTVSVCENNPVLALNMHQVKAQDLLNK
ncbi:MAG: 4'-phosphopantetheinyl transferase superfamily protein [Clostridia bacterium]|nr:4'-phosphopantetheinyl transferase superfamily protein [Clostridia bacterium]